MSNSMLANDDVDKKDQFHRSHNLQAFSQEINNLNWHI